VIGAVHSICRFPVKSMLRERLETAAVTPGGVLGDRSYALIDHETQKVVTGTRSTTSATDASQLTRPPSRHPGTKRADTTLITADRARRALGRKRRGCLALAVAT
jgi:uncharacterized protein YcbX